MSVIKNLDAKIRAYALKNAISHDGKAQPGAVISALIIEGLDKSKVKDVMPQVNKLVQDMNKLSLPEQEKLFSELQEFVSEREGRKDGELPELPNAKKGKIVMRFAPSPSGPLHIGHAATGCISALYVKKYGGTFYVRIEDTNPENIYTPAYKMIAQESEWLFGKETKVLIQSDRMQIYYDYVEKLLKKDAVYVCTCSQEDFKKLADGKKDCPCRVKTSKENIADWKEMLDKKGFPEGGAVLRFKSGMQQTNPAFRDFPLARINESEHPRQKKKYRVWPLMNLAVAVDDIELGMTHIIRAKDHRDNAKRQELIFNVLGKPIPWSAFLGKYHFTDFELSSTQTRKAIEEGKYSGWDDPKLPTIASLKKQGYKPQAFWGFAVRVGLSENDKIMERSEYFSLLDLFNKENQ